MHKSGEDHPNCKLTDRDIELMRELYDVYGIGYKKLAEKFECSPAHARDVVKYRTRLNVIVAYNRRVDE